MRLNWQLWAGNIPPDKCEELVKLCQEKCTMKEGTIFGQVKNARKVNIGWMDDPKLKDTLSQYLNEANRNAFNVNISYVPPVQYAEYTPGNFYNWHHDINWEEDLPFDRKLSICVQLSDPETYEGGVFEFRGIENPVEFRKQGSVLVFPSYLEHRITPITDGVRRSLVTWAEGPRWR